MNIFKHFRMVEKRSTFSHHKNMLYSKQTNFYKSKNNNASNPHCIFYINGLFGAEYGLLNNLLQYSQSNNTNLYHLDLFDILTKNFYLPDSFLHPFESVTFVSSDYGIYGLNTIKENHQDLLFTSQLQTESVIVNPQLAFDYLSLNHIGQKLVTMKVKDDLLRAIGDLKKNLEAEYSNDPKNSNQGCMANGGTMG